MAKSVGNKHHRPGAKTRDMPERFESGWLDLLDSRTALAREMRDRYQCFTDDLGGLDRLSYAQRSLVERALWLEFWIASLERKLAAGEDLNIGQWTQATNTLQGILAKLGLDRVAQDVPNLTTWIKERSK